MWRRFSLFFLFSFSHSQILVRLILLQRCFLIFISISVVTANLNNKLWGYIIWIKVSGFILTASKLLQFSSNFLYKRFSYCFFLTTNIWLRLYFFIYSLNYLYFTILILLQTYSTFIHCFCLKNIFYWFIFCPFRLRSTTSCFIIVILFIFCEFYYVLALVRERLIIYFVLCFKLANESF